jgi:hypothetical protein
MTASLDLVGRIRKVGNSLALLIPAKEGRRAGLREGQTVRAHLEPELPEPLGLLADLPYEPFDRHREGLWRDRL